MMDSNMSKTNGCHYPGKPPSELFEEIFSFVQWPRQTQSSPDIQVNHCSLVREHRRTQSSPDTQFSQSLLDQDYDREQCSPDTYLNPSPSTQAHHCTQSSPDTQLNVLPPIKNLRRTQCFPITHYSSMQNNSPPSSPLEECDLPEDLPLTAFFLSQIPSRPTWADLDVWTEDQLEKRRRGFANFDREMHIQSAQIIREWKTRWFFGIPMTGISSMTTPSSEEVGSG